MYSWSLQSQWSKVSRLILIQNTDELKLTVPQEINNIKLIKMGKCSSDITEKHKPTIKNAKP